MPHRAALLGGPPGSPAWVDRTPMGTAALGLPDSGDLAPKAPDPYTGRAAEPYRCPVGVGGAVPTLGCGGGVGAGTPRVKVRPSWESLPCKEKHQEKGGLDAVPPLVMWLRLEGGDGVEDRS